MDLIGIPLRITIGKKISDNIVEVKPRRDKEFKEINISQLDNYITDFLGK